MLSNNDFDQIVSGFYRAAGGMANWADALRPVQRAMSAWVVQLLGVDIGRGAVLFSYEVGDAPPEAAVDLIRTYHRIDPRAGMLLQLKPGEWVNCWEHFDEEFVARDPFYQEFLIPYGGRFASGTKLIEDGDLAVIWGVHRGRGQRVLNSDEIACCERLSIHLTGALRLYRINLKLRQTIEVGAELFANLRCPVVLINEEREVLHINRAAAALLATDPGISARSGRLQCTGRADDIALVSALRALALSGDAGPLDRKSGVEKAFLRLNVSTNRSEIGLYIHSLRPQTMMFALGDEPLAMVLFHDPTSRLEIDPFLLAAAFELTPGEARVAAELATGRSLNDIASDHHVSVATIKTQMGSIFAKTKTKRQAELVSLILNMPVGMLRP